MKRSGPYCDGFSCYSIPLPIIIAIIVGGLVFSGCLVAWYFVLRWHRRRRSQRKNDQDAQQVLALPSEPIALTRMLFRHGLFHHLRLSREIVY